MGNSSAKTSFTGERRIRQLSENVWNVRANFKVFSVLSIGTHMTFMRVSSGRFLVIDTVPLDDELRAEIDQLTNQGQLIEAVIATHPFHTLSFAAFYEAYPNARYFGTPRHIRVVPQIPWVGDIRDHLNDWSLPLPPVSSPVSSPSSSSSSSSSTPEPALTTSTSASTSLVASLGAAPILCTVQMRIPAGAEYENPLPELSNHFVSVFVYHVTDRVLHVDDTLNLYNGDVSFLLRLVGVAAGRFSFHPAIKGPGLHPTQQAPLDFLAWMQALLDEWDIDIVCCAHRDVQTHSCQPMLQAALDEIRPILLKKSRSNAEENQGAKLGHRPRSHRAMFTVQRRRCRMRLIFPPSRAGDFSQTTDVGRRRTCWRRDFKEERWNLEQ